MRLYVAISVGCIDCGNQSFCLGAFKTRGEARAALLKAWSEASPEEMDSWLAAPQSPYGQGYPYIFEVEAPAL